jgi:hypothetical protein
VICGEDAEELVAAGRGCGDQVDGVGIEEPSLGPWSTGSATRAIGTAVSSRGHGGYLTYDAIGGLVGRQGRGVEPPADIAELALHVGVEGFVAMR